MFEKLAETQPLPDTSARVLAAKRQQAIIDALENAGIDGEQLQRGGITRVESKRDEGVTTQLALEARPGPS